jgi:hypothetical protein
MKTIKNILVITFPSIILFFLLLDLFFRLIIPASDPPKGLFDEAEKMEYFSTEREDGVYTIGRFSEIRARWHINNMHWNYPIDYQSNNGKKLIPVIGDSFIEAFQVNVGKNYPYLLREQILNDYEVYAFGKSGAPLSQYLQISRYVKRHFNPDIFIINVVYNDFDESIKELSHNDMPFLKISIDTNGSLSEIQPVPTYSSQHHMSIKKLLLKSALFRYLYFNLQIMELRNNIKSHSNPNFEANINPRDVRDNEELISRVTDYLVKTLREENKEKRIIIIMDAPRANIYNHTLNKSKVLWMNEMMSRICKNHDIEFIDLTSCMYHDYQVNSIKFNSETDGHWNEYGHKFVSKILYEYLNEN